MKDKFRSGLNTRVFEEYDRLKDAADSEHTRNRCKEAISLYGQALRLIDRSFVGKKYDVGTSIKTRMFTSAGGMLQAAGGF